MPADDPRDPGSSGERGSGSEPDPEAVVNAASDAAESVVFARFDATEVRDLDVTASFEGGRLEVDVYLDAVEDARADPERVTEDAALAARGAVDDLLGDRA